MKQQFIFSLWAMGVLATGSTIAQHMPSPAQPSPMAMPSAKAVASQPMASDPNTPVPAVVYRSVFKETSLGVEKETQNWRKANDEVGKFLRGHVDILKWEEQESAKPGKSGMDKPAMPGKSDAAKTAPSVAATPALAAPSTASPATTRSPASAHKH